MYAVVKKRKDRGLKMKTLQTHKNGQVLQAIKTYKELTETERKVLTIPRGKTLDDYKDFIVHYNKNGELLRVALNNFSDDYIKKLNNERKKANLVDVCTVAFSKSNKQKSKIKKRIGDENYKKLKRYTNTII